MVSAEFQEVGMGKVNIKALFAITSVMGLLMFLLSEKGDYVYLIDYGSQPLLVKMTYFGLLVSPFLAIVGRLSIWQTGAINQNKKYVFSDNLCIHKKPGIGVD